MAGGVQVASDINNKTIASSYASPYISYKITYTAVRNGNAQVTYNFKIQSLLVGDSSSRIGTGKILSCNIKVGDGSGTVKLKESTDVWSGGSSSGTVKSTKTLSITCTSSVSNENQTVTFTVTRPDGTGHSGEVDNNTAYYVTSPALLTSTCSAPSIFIASPNGFRDNVSLFWSGASGGNDNDMIGYQIRYKTSNDNSIWEAETDLTLVASEDVNSCVIDMSDKIKEGQYVRFAIRTLCNDSDYYSSWVYSNIIRRNASYFNIAFGLDNTWSNSQVFFGKDGSWISSQISFGNGDSWVNIK